MLHINEVELYEEPLTVALEQKYLIYRETEMSYYDLYFLCGLLRKVKPHNIVEIGVAHRLSTVRKCDYIMKLEPDGSIHTFNSYQSFMEAEIKEI